MSVDIKIKVQDQASPKIDEIQRKVGELEKRMNMVASAGAGLKTVGSKLTNYITKPALVAGSALAAMTLKAGFSRFTKIDEARAKLKGLGNDAKKVDAIMDNALQSVIGTQYNLDEAATTAASAVAAGIKPGKDLTKYLSSVTDAAAIAGISMADMGSIFNKVAAKGKATAREIMELANRGIPIWQYLAKETGKSVAEVQKAVSKGEVDISVFRKAIENNIGGAAKTMGKISWKGAIANFKAAVGRIGANLWGATDDANSVSHLLLRAFNEVLVPLEKIEEKSAEMGQKVGQVFKGIYNYMKTGKFGDNILLFDGSTLKIFDKLQPHLDRIKAFGEWFSGLSGKGKGIFVGAIVGAGPLLKILGSIQGIMESVGNSKLFGKIVTNLAKTHGSLTGLFGKLFIGVGIFTALYTHSESFRNAVNNLVKAIGELLVPVFQNLQTVAGPALKLISSAFSLIGAVISPIITIISQLISWIANKLSPSAQKHAGAIASTFSKITGVLNTIKSAIDKVKSAWDNWKPKIKALTTKNQGYAVDSGGQKPHEATGTKSAKGGMTLVGERGPELVNLPKGASVHTARETSKMLGGNTINMPITMNVSDKGLSIDQVVSELSARLSEAIQASAEGAIA